MIRKTLIAIAMLLVSNAGFASNNNRNGLVAKGDSCVTENDYFHALDYFQKAQKIRDTKDLQMKIADCYYCRYQLKECITILEKIKEDSLSHDAFKELYYAYGAMENPSTQEIYGYALIRRFPMDSKILASLMHLIIDNDKYGTRQFLAVEFGEKYYKKDSDNVEVNRALAQAYFFSQKYDKSLNMYQRLLQEKDTTFSGLYYTGLCYEYLHNLDSAKVYLQKGCEHCLQKIQSECIV
jgi:tetratricopeptide (TPR) repeat protein